MSVILRYPNFSLWEQICRQFRKERRETESDQCSVSTQYSEFEPAKHNPVFYNTLYAKVDTDFHIPSETDPGVGHPTCAGYWLQEVGVKGEESPSPQPPDKATCSNRAYLDAFVWPCLLPALHTTLTQARKEGCFGLKKVPFCCVDFLTQLLYNTNPLHPDRHDVELEDIPFVRAWLDLHPRPPKPISLTWTEDETAVKIQCVWRGYKVRCHPEVQELRQWQKEWRIINRGGRIHEEVNGFWERLMPTSESSASSQPQSTPSHRSACSSAKTLGPPSPSTAYPADTLPPVTLPGPCSPGPDPARP